MQIDESKLIDVVDRLCGHTVVAELGPGAADAIARLWPTVRDMYRFVEPLMLQQPIAVAVAVEAARDMPARIGSQPREFASLELASNEVRDGGWILEVRASGAIRLWQFATIDLAALASFAVVYTFDAGTETLLAGSRTCLIPNMAPNASPSAFARPTFLNLEAALEHYRQRVARTCVCHHLQEAIFDKPRRLYWKAKPEMEMRRSLFKYLYDVLSGDAEIRPEQIVDESHPVDIKATWTFANRLALIEIKWIGDSRNPDGTSATKYRDARARSGAQQLANYLDANRQLTPTHHSKGYLVVFDARRAGLGDGVDLVGRDQGFQFERQEISYNPAYHTQRRDFARPLRFFVEPIL